VNIATGNLDKTSTNATLTKMLKRDAIWSFLDRVAPRQARLAERSAKPDESSLDGAFLKAADQNPPKIVLPTNEPNEREAAVCPTPAPPVGVPLSFPPRLWV